MNRILLPLLLCLAIFFAGRSPQASPVDVSSPHILPYVEAHQILQVTLSQKEYKRSGFWTVFFRRVAHFFQRWTEYVLRGMERFSQPALILVFLLTGVVLFYVFQTLYLFFRPGSRVSSITPTKTSVRETSQSLYKMAEKALKDGNYRESIRYLYRGFLLHLDEKQVFPLELEKGLTNWEILRKLARVLVEPGRDAFHSANELYDRVIFGRVPASYSDCEVMRTQLAVVKESFYSDHA